MSGFVSSAIREKKTGINEMRLNKKKSNEEEPMDPMGKLSRSTFVDVLYRTASSGQLTDMWTSLSRNTFVQITHLFDSSNSKS